MTSQILFFLAVLLIAFLSINIPLITGIILSVVIISFLRKPVIVHEDIETIKVKCTKKFKEFIYASINKDSKKLENICMKSYQLENLPSKIIEAELISQSVDKAEIKFTMISTHGDIIENNVAFVKTSSNWIIEEIK